MRKRNNFISVFTMFLAIGFAIIFSIPVKATANGVQLKANRTYTAYDVTGDGTKDKIRIRAANQTDDAGTCGEPGNHGSFQRQDRHV